MRAVYPQLLERPPYSTLPLIGLIFVIPFSRPFYRGSLFMNNGFEIKQKALYKTLQPVFCPALQETVYFNADGFHHLIFEKRRPRNTAERFYRLSLLPHIHEVVTNATQAKQKIISNDPPIITWELKHKFIKPNTNNKPCITKVIIIRKKPAGRLYFLSIMCKGWCRPRKKFLGII